MRNFLSHEEIQTLKEQHKKERDKRIADRIKTVLLFNKGWDYSRIAEALLITSESARNHLRDYQEDKKLEPENGGLKLN